MDDLFLSSGTPSDEELRQLIIASLKEQGFEVHGRSIDLPTEVDKEKLRQLHAVAVKHRIAKAEGGLRRHEAKLLLLEALENWGIGAKTNAGYGKDEKGQSIPLSLSAPDGWVTFL